jgi:hypothetical protein
MAIQVLQLKLQCFTLHPLAHILDYRHVWAVLLRYRTVYEKN